MEDGDTSLGQQMATGPAAVPPDVADSPRIGKIERVPLREVWPHEAYDLTTWLEENIDVLNHVLDLNLSNVEREHAAGSFSVDLIAEDDSGGIAVIENPIRHDPDRRPCLGERGIRDQLAEVVVRLP